MWKMIYLRNKIKLFLCKSRNKLVGFSFMALAFNGHRRNIVLPKNFNLDSHLALYPPKMHGFANSNLKFSKDKIYYFLSLLSTIPARNKNLIDEEGWVPINARIVRNNIKDIRLYKDYLLNTGILECNNIYIPQVKSLCYRWNKHYTQSGFQIYNVICKHEEDVYFIQDEENKMLVDFPYLYHWYNNNKLAINPIILQYAEAIFRYKMSDKSKWNINTHTNKLKYPLTQYTAALTNINKIEQYRYEIHIDSTVYRLHSVITNLQKDYRNFLTYNGQELFSIDIKNSQPYLACALLNPMFWHINNELSLSLYSLPGDIQRTITTVAIPLEVEIFLQDCTDKDFYQYKEIVANGKIYEVMAEVCQASLDKPIDRKEAKILMFYLLFSSNQGQHDDITINQMRKIFSSELFPKVSELFKLIKRKYKHVENEKQHNRLACLLQSIESEIILHRCCKRIWEEGNQQIPVFTIHDSIATTIEHVEYVKKVMEEELFKAIGISPTLSIEHWNLSQVENRDMLPQT